RRVEEYLNQYPELRSSTDSLTEIVQQEYFVRSRHGEHPSAAELQSRFPNIDERRVLHTDECLLNTVAFNQSPVDTQRSADQPDDVARTGTIFFDTKKSGSTGAGSVSSGTGSNAPASAPASRPIAMGADPSHATVGESVMARSADKSAAAK